MGRRKVYVRSYDVKVGRVDGMEIILGRGFVLATVVLHMTYMVLGIAVFGRHPLNAIAGAFVLVLLHWFSETWHNYGHYWAARSTGFPMEGVRLGTALLVFGTSLYPADEQELSARVHIRRAIGGPVANALLGGVGAVATIVLGVLNSHFLWVGVVFTLENLLVFTLGNFLPLGFNDGSTLLHWLRRR